MLLRPTARRRLPCKGVYFNNGSNPQTEQLSAIVPGLTFAGATMCGWMYHITLNLSWCLFELNNGTINQGIFGGSNFGVGNAGAIGPANGSVFTTAATITAGEWVFAAVTISTGANQTIGYVRQKGGAMASLTLTAGTGAGPYTMTIGNDSPSFADGCADAVYAGITAYSRVLSPAEIFAQSNQLAPITSYGLQAYLPMRSAGTAAVDEWQRGRVWTKAGAAFQEGNRSPIVPEVTHAKTLFFLSSPAAVEEGAGNVWTPPGDTVWTPPPASFGEEFVHASSLLTGRQYPGPAGLGSFLLFGLNLQPRVAFPDEGSSSPIPTGDPGLSWSAAPALFTFPEDLASLSATGLEDGATASPLFAAALTAPYASTAGEDAAPTALLDEGAAASWSPSDAPLVWQSWWAPEDFAGFLTVEDGAGPTAVPLPDVGTWTSVTAANEDNAASLTVDDSPGPAAWARPDIGAWLPVAAQGEDNAPALTVDDGAGPTAIPLPDLGTWVSVTSNVEDTSPSLTLADSSGPTVAFFLDAAFTSAPASPEDFAQTTAAIVDESAGSAWLAPESPWLASARGDEDLASTSAASMVDEPSATAWVYPDFTWIAPRSVPEDFAGFLTIDDGIGGPAWSPSEAAPWIGPYAFGEDVRGLPVVEERTFTWQAPEVPAWVLVAAQGEDNAPLLTIDDATSFAAIFPEPTPWQPFNVAELIASTVTTIGIDDAPGLAFVLEPPPWIVGPQQPEDIARTVANVTIDDAPGPTAWIVPDPGAPWLTVTSNVEDFSPRLTVDDSPGPTAWILPDPGAPWLTVTANIEDNAPRQSVDDSPGPTAWPYPDTGAWLTVTANAEEVSSQSVEDGPGPTAVPYPDLGTWISVTAANEDSAPLTPPALGDEGWTPVILYVESPTRVAAQDEDFSPLLTVDDGAAPTALAYPDLGAWLSVTAANEDSAPQTPPALDESGFTPVIVYTDPLPQSFGVSEEVSSLTLDDAAGPTALPYPDAGTWLTVTSAGEDSITSSATGLEDGEGFTALPWADAGLPLTAASLEDLSPYLTVDDAPGPAAWAPVDASAWLSVTAANEDDAPVPSPYEEYGPTAWSVQDTGGTPLIFASGDEFVGLVAIDDAAGPTALPLPDVGTWVTVAANVEDLSQTLTVDDATAWVWQGAEPAAWQPATVAEDVTSRPVEETAGTVSLPAVDAAAALVASSGEDPFQSPVLYDETSLPAWLPAEALAWQPGTVGEEIGTPHGLDESPGWTWRADALPTWLTWTFEEGICRFVTSVIRGTCRSEALLTAGVRTEPLRSAAALSEKLLGGSLQSEAPLNAAARSVALLVVGGVIPPPGPLAIEESQGFVFARSPDVAPPIVWSAVEDISAPVTPASILGGLLFVWLDSELGIHLTSGNVDTWSDQSGNGNHVIQAVGAKRPAYVVGGGANGHNYLLWTQNSAAILKCAALSATLSTPCEYWFVADYDGTGTNNYGLDFGGNVHALQAIASPSASWTVGQTDSTCNFNGVSANVPHILNYQMSAGSSAATLDGSGLVTNSTAPTSGVTTMQVGSYGGDLGAFSWGGRMYSIIVALGGVSAGQRAAMNAYAVARWGT